MRIISGKFRGKKFFPPKGFPSRPTTDAAKEALFNILDSRMYFENLDVLDLFAGTGNISFEFLSRGVGRVVSVDKHAVSHNYLLKLRAETKLDNWQIIRQNAFTYIQNCPAKFDLIFADPPYGLNGVSSLPDKICELGLLVDDGTLIIEHGSENNFQGSTNFKETRNYGGVQFSFFEKH